MKDPAYILVKNAFGFAVVVLTEKQASTFVSTFALLEVQCVHFWEKYEHLFFEEKNSQVNK